MTIPKTFEDSFAHVRELAARFAENEAAYLSPKYIEQEVRGQFLDPFFEALGWDVYHREHPNPYEREVKIEKSVMVGDRGKRADYAFFTKPNFFQARFLAEAKKPARNLENPNDCFQAIRYGWNSNTPIAVLTDFEHFIVLDSRSKPNVDKALHLILQKFHYSQFADEEEFRKLYYLFSREAVVEGSIEKFVTGLKKGKKAKLDAAAPAIGTVQVEPVGDTFLNELDRERENLARAFKSGNENLDGDELTEITQRTLDRLVFIRFLEDKLVEPSEIIDRFGKKTGNAWRDFANEMPRLNSIYNGIIFKPHPILDSPTFEPDERRFRLTVNWLSHRNSSYDFNTIPIHILGSIYERFLGKTITVTGKRPTVEEKPEVRKAGGVYYTPEYIVTYIVENTIGKLIAGKTPDEISEMRFADIACGSGSFLLGMFDCLIKYHVEWYGKNKTRREASIKKNLVRETADGNLQLTLEHKRDILLNNIYGVDLDAQAVEVAQLSLYVKLLEEETAASVQPKIGARRKLGGLGEQLLPSLGKNIVHGNSLIDYDIMDGLGFDAFEHRKLYPMNFEQTFPKVFANGGFDAIVGNPPYDVLEKDRGEERTPHSVLSEYVRRRADYVDALGGKLNLFRFFIVRGATLLRKNGYFGLIVPLALVGDISCGRTRTFVTTRLDNLRLDCFPQKDNPNNRIFQQAKLSTVIFTGRWTASSDSPVSIRVFPGKSFEDEFLSNSVSISELNCVSPGIGSIPLVSAAHWTTCVKIHSTENVSSLSALAPDFVVSRGEINQTIFRAYINSESTNVRLVKGVEIGQYLIRAKLSQGEREWFDEEAYLKTNNPKSLASVRRIATQRITGIDERLRVVAMIVEPRAYFADSTNSSGLFEWISVFARIPTGSAEFPHDAMALQDHKHEQQCRYK